VASIRLEVLSWHIWIQTNYNDIHGIIPIPVLSAALLVCRDYQQQSSDVLDLVANVISILGPISNPKSHLHTCSDTKAAALPPPLKFEGPLPPCRPSYIVF
jgi:hypothetical protein